VDYGKVYKTPVRLEIKRDDGSPKASRFFVGYLAEFSFVGGDGKGHYEYRARMVPKYHWLTYNRAYLVFANQTGPDIVRKLLAKYELSHLMVTPQGGVPTRNYCLMYGESVWGFLSRLLEEEGMFYFVDHQPYGGDPETYNPQFFWGEDFLNVFSSWDDVRETDFPEIRFLGAGAESGEAEERVLSLRVVDRTLPDEVRVGDHNPADFRAYLQQDKAQPYFGIGNRVEQIYGGFAKSDDAEHYAKIRMEEVASGHERIVVESTYRGAAAGRKIRISGHPRQAVGSNTWMILRVVHRGSQPTTGSQGTEAPKKYANTFEAVPIKSDITYRPPRRHPKPRALGSQTAMVMGPSGGAIDHAEIHTDEKGRVKIQFLWDQDVGWDEDNAVWVHVAQSYSGAGYGSRMIPRVGHQVVVSFLNGDPDRPLVTGSVHDGAHQTPHVTKDNKTQWSMKSFSGNEIRFEDAPGKEEFYVHASRVHTTSVVSSQSLSVGGDRSMTIDGNLTEHVKKEQKTTVDGKWTENGKGGIEETYKYRKTTIGGGTGPGGKASETGITGDAAISASGAATVSVTGASTLTLGGVDATVTGDVILGASGALAAATAGVSFDSSADVSITASGTITLAVGGSKVEISSGGVKISGPKVETAATGQNKVGGATVEVNGSGGVQIKGATVTNN
jgi:type VI secretion system secreted protein VgrG